MRDPVTEANGLLRNCRVSKWKTWSASLFETALTMPLFLTYVLPTTFCAHFNMLSKTVLLLHAFPKAFKA